MDILSTWCTNQLIYRNIIDKSQKNIYIYGFQLFLSTLCSVSVMLCTAFLTGNFLRGVIFLTVFMSLRMTANGYHAKTYLGCFILSNSLFLFYLFLLSACTGTEAEYFFGIFAAVSSIYIFVKAPVEHPNHKLSDLKRKVNRERARKLLIFTWFVSACLYFLKKWEFVTAIHITLCLVAVMMIIKNKGGN